jgi:NDP-sugar pyrophosphorylase family protein
MQAVILAAGRGTRMKELTEKMPKPMIVVNGRPFLEYALDMLPPAVTEIIIVIGYMGDAIKKHFGDMYKGKSIRYVVQENYVGGTADAVWRAREFLEGKFFVLNGDDVFDTDALVRASDFEWAMLVYKKDAVGKAGKVIVDDQGVVENVLEAGDHDGGEGLVNTGAYVLDTRVFAHNPVPKAIGSSELGLPQTVVEAAQGEHIDVHTVPAKFWIQFTAPEDIPHAADALKNISAN